MGRCCPRCDNFGQFEVNLANSSGSVIVSYTGGELPINLRDDCRAPRQRLCPLRPVRPRRPTMLEIGWVADQPEPRSLQPCGLRARPASPSAPPSRSRRRGGCDCRRRTGGRSGGATRRRCRHRNRGRPSAGLSGAPKTKRHGSCCRRIGDGLSTVQGSHGGTVCARFVPQRTRNRTIGRRRTSKLSRNLRENARPADVVEPVDTQDLKS